MCMSDGQPASDPAQRASVTKGPCLPVVTTAAWLVAALGAFACGSPPGKGTVRPGGGDDGSNAFSDAGSPAPDAGPRAADAPAVTTDAPVATTDGPASVTDAPAVPAVTKPIDVDVDYPNKTETLYLSGHGIDDAVPWGFTIDAGRRAGEVTTIPVPSNWEFHGFGTFHYGQGETRSTERGLYKRTFDVPATWVGKRIFIAFEGAMTDTSIKINGQSAGPTHQGSFYRFKYDITALVKMGMANQLEVTVSNESANSSVNEAERTADYWIFGGIFRPVYLEAFPAASIDRFAIDAKADGTLNVDVFLRGLLEKADVVAHVLDDSLAPVGPALTATAAAGQAQVKLTGMIPGVKPWSAEAPQRYRLAVELTTASGVHHAVRENFGFRTVEVRAGDGIYVNGNKVMMRGLTRHCFWPESGRALSPRISLADATLLKSLNANAVRTSHYPPDRHFLEATDRLGLYVLDELAGWHTPPYDTVVGRNLIEEMVTFDVNHPSIVFWDNGNEGGWNTALDGDFATWDPQHRSVIHPFANFSNINTDHYPSYATTLSSLGGNTLFMPTEFMHGLYDGGGGAGLEDYWTAMRGSPRGAGGFIWALLDEGVKRDDQGGMIDTKGNLAPDGVVGPYRQWEGSAYTIRQLWSPVRITTDKLPADFAGTLTVENTYDTKDLNTVSFTWQLVTFDLHSPTAARTVMAQGTARTASIAARKSGTLALGLPADWATAQTLLLDATDEAGTLIGRWSWLIGTQAKLRETIVPATSNAAAAAVDAGGTVTVTAGTASYTFNKATGQLAQVKANGKAFSLRNGPALSVGTATLTSFSGAQDGKDYVITCIYGGTMQQVLWRVMGNGWLGLTYRYSLNGSYDFAGVDFDYPEAQVQGVEWLGLGPERVWKNRMKGPWLDLWTRDKNDAVTGQRWDYPEFKGYFANVAWARLRTSEGPISLVIDSDDIFLRLYTPASGPSPRGATAAFPAHDLSFLHAIPPIGNKFQAAADTGPQGQQNKIGGALEGQLFLQFGDGS
jgi:beta-galactosidase/beta-glucuronidase